MQKLESYLTPLILDKLAKYVHIRKEDFKMSMWEGEAAFQNIDLRLDALEELLQLPFEFVSGRIHELTIQIPWSKIMLKPIKIIINTMDIVLKLRKGNKPERRTQKSKQENPKIDVSQKGYIANHINKILNNISVNFENIILKCIEGDIILSVNVRQLSISSANKKWEEALSNSNPLRKLIQVSDLSICLDKANENGKIEETTEPVLSKCSVEIRIFHKYNSSNMETILTTKVHIYSNTLNITILSFQYPLILSIIDLLKSLMRSIQKPLSDNQDSTQDQENSSTTQQSYLSWAWQRLPKILPSEPTSEKLEENNYFDIGVYLNELKISIKALELFSGKHQGSPILGITLKGLFSETLISNRNWFNTKAGTSSILVEPLGNFRSSSSCYFISSLTEFSDSYLNGSMFKNPLIQQKEEYITDLKLHLDKYNDVFFVTKGSVAAFDLVHITDENRLQAPESIQSQHSLQRFSIRVLLSSCKLSFNAALSTIIDTLKELYTSYRKERSRNQMKLNTIDLMGYGIPKRNIEVLFGQIQIDLETQWLPLPKSKTTGKHK